MLLLLGHATVVRGQVVTPGPTHATTVLDRRFAAGEEVSIHLTFERGVVYRIWLSRPAQVHGPANEHVPFPFIVDVTGSAGIDNGVEFEMYPQATRAVTLLIGPASKDSVTDVVIWRDIPGTVRGDPNERAPDDNWEFGFEVAGGWHDRMGTGSAGGTFEGCVRARRGGGRQSRLSGCLFGVAVYDRPGAGKISLFFLEPRVRLAGAPLAVYQGGNEFGAAMRLGLFGSDEGADAARGGVGLFGFGLYVEHGFGRADRGSGLGIRLSGMMEGVSDGSSDFNTTTVRLGMSYQF